MLSRSSIFGAVIAAVTVCGFTFFNENKKQKQSIEELQQKIADTIPRPSIELNLLVPYSHGEIVSRLHQWDAEILRTAFVSDGTYVQALVRDEVASELSEFVLDDELFEILQLEIDEAVAAGAVETTR